MVGPKGLKRAILAALALACLAPAPASAATATIGGDLLGPAPTGGVCTGCVTVQTAQTGGAAPFPLLSPVNGRITAWKVRTNQENALYTLRVLRPGGTLVYTGAGSSPAPTATPPGTTDSTFTYLASLPINQGDAIGAQSSAGKGPPEYTAPSTDVMAFISAIADGATATIPGGQNLPMHELYLQATVNFCTVPKVKNKRVKKAKKLIRAAGCTPKVKKKSSRKPEKKVFRQKVAPGTTRDPEAPVKILVSTGP